MVKSRVDRVEPNETFGSRELSDSFTRLAKDTFLSRFYRLSPLYVSKQFASRILYGPSECVSSTMVNRDAIQVQLLLCPSFSVLMEGFQFGIHL